MDTGQQEREGRLTWMPRVDNQHSMSASRPAVRTSSASDVAKTGYSQDLQSSSIVSWPFFFSSGERHGSQGVQMQKMERSSPQLVDAALWEGWGLHPDIGHFLRTRQALSVHRHHNIPCTKQEQGKFDVSPAGACRC